eukprot:CAMPEP_0182423966 /NCGR_PEP_ID=MMETSP1167-20130531/10067_1 /TAXON_ID=2988 /ORGANISM="Mallomonas Sp, Strain CCMP3275" /LENGTH=258 /DNA_ID=CAMNT_0024603381 /DNA_START=160 /DNA_END=933 /DNA_ORIENTATION=+
MIWKEEEEDIISENKKNFHLPAPKMPLPGHAESYNPPDEYLMTEEEIEKMLDLDPLERQYDFIPKKYDSLRHVQGYNNFIRERFERCLDLYLCPRKLKRRLNIDPNTLIPRLPKPSELKPYPNSLCLQYLGHEGKIRGLSLSSDGQYLASCSDDKTVRIWEVETCLCRYHWSFQSPVIGVEWNPNPSHHILAVLVNTQIVFINTGTGDKDDMEITETLFTTLEAKARGEEEERESEDEEEEEEEGEKEREKEKMKAVW